MYPDFVVLLGREVPLVPYIIPAGKELAQAIEGVVVKHNALLLRNHGLLTLGTNLKEAYFRALALEEACWSLMVAKIMGEVRFLTEEEIEGIENLEAERFRKKLLRAGE